jgi:hypothetical protein
VTVMSALTALPTKTPEDRYRDCGPGSVPAVCSIAMLALGLDQDGCDVTSASAENTRSRGASIAIVNRSAIGDSYVSGCLRSCQARPGDQKNGR